MGFDHPGDLGQAGSVGYVGDLNARGDGARSGGGGGGDGARPQHHGGAGDDRRHDRASGLDGGAIIPQGETFYIDVFFFFPITETTRTRGYTTVQRARPLTRFM